MHVNTVEIKIKLNAISLACSNSTTSFLCKNFSVIIIIQPKNQFHQSIDLS